MTSKETTESDKEKEDLSNADISTPKTSGSMPDKSQDTEQENSQSSKKHQVDFATIANEDKTELETPSLLNNDKLSSEDEFDQDKTVILPPDKQHSVISGVPAATQKPKKTKLGMPPGVREAAASKQQNQSSKSTEESSNEPKVGPGKVLKGRYDLFEKLGEGGMGVVYKALDRRDVEAGNTIFIAIKVLNDAYKSNPDVLKALHSEARKTQQLKHPNIITVFDFDRDDDAVFMTMEYMNGATLDYMIKSNPNGLKFKDVISVIDQLGHALSFAHSNRVIHCDFKPGNIFIDRANNAKILDFGIARVSSLTQANRFDAGILGALTPAYASLEMLQGDDPDPRDDIYAFACVIYELLTGRHPFNRNDARRAKYNNQKPKEIKSLNRKQWHALKKALAFDRAQRSKNIEELLNGLHGRNDTWLYALGGVVVAAGVGLYISNTNLPNMSEDSASKPDKTEIPVKTPELSSEIDKEPNERISKPVTAVVKPIQKPEPYQNLGKIKVWTEKSRYKIGDNLQVNFSVEKPMYVRVALIDSNGEVTQLFPNPYQENNYCQPGIEYQIPPKNSDLELTIFGPTGVDHITAVAKPKQFSAEVMKFSKTGKLIGTDKQGLVIGSVEYRIR